MTASYDFASTFPVNVCYELVGDLIYPCSKVELERLADEWDLPEVILDFIDRLPEREFRTPTEILAFMKAT